MISLLFMLCYIRLYRIIERIEETERNEGHLVINLFVCASDSLEFQISQQIFCRIFLVHLYRVDLF